jgi:P27 family predicted phage terminase small subunit
MGLLTSVDRAALAAYCQTYSRWAKAETNIAQYGSVLKSPKSGFPIANPYVGIANRALDQMRKFAVEFGLTPASRSRLSIQTAPSADPFETFMSELMDDNPADEFDETSADSTRVREERPEREDSGVQVD